MKKKTSQQPPIKQHRIRFLPVIIAFLFIALCVRVACLSYHWFLWRPESFNFITRASAAEMPQNESADSGASSDPSGGDGGLNTLPPETTPKASPIPDEGKNVKIIAGVRDVRSAYSQASLAEEKKKEKEREEKEKEKKNEQEVLKKAKQGATSMDTPQAKQIKADLFKTLENRNKELDQKQQVVKQQQLLLQVAEQKLINRQKKLLDIEKNIQSLVDRYNKSKEKDQEKLVSIYSAMKPKAAAAIFDTMDMSTLIAVVRGMSSRTLAPILAAMDPNKATLITRKLANVSDVDINQTVSDKK